MSRDERSKERDQKSSPNVRRLIPRDAPSSPKAEQWPGLTGKQSGAASNDDDPGPTAA